MARPVARAKTHRSAMGLWLYMFYMGTAMAPTHPAAVPLPLAAGISFSRSMPTANAEASDGPEGTVGKISTQCVFRSLQIRIYRP